MIKALLSEPDHIVRLIKQLSPDSKVTINGDVISVEYPICYIIVNSDRHSGTSAIIHRSFLTNAKDALREHFGVDTPIKTGKGEWYEIKQDDDYTNTFYVPEFSVFQ